MLKATVLLSIAIFLTTAPQPDAKDLARMSGSFIIVHADTGLMAADDIRNLEPTADETRSDAVD